MTHTDGQRSRATFQLGRAEVVVDDAGCGAVDWLVQFLTPAVTVVDEGQHDVRRARPPHVHVHVVSSTHRFEALMDRLVTHSHEWPVFSLDREVVHLPGIVEDDGEYVLFDAAFEAVYHVRSGSIEVVGRDTARRHRLGLMRVVRELLTAGRLIEDDVLDLHAAAFETRGVAVLLAGAKYAGKTTTLSHALASGARLIANDRVLVSLAEGMHYAQGVPSLVAVRPGSRCFIPALEQGSTRVPVSHRAGEQFCVEDAAPLAGGVDSMSPRRLAELLSTSCVQSAPSCIIVFPRIVRDVDEWAVVPLGGDGVLEQLKSCVYGAERGDPAVTVLSRLWGSARTGAMTQVGTRELEALTAGVRFAELHLGRRAYERSAMSWVQALLSGQ